MGLALRSAVLRLPLTAGYQSIHGHKVVSQRGSHERCGLLNHTHGNVLSRSGLACLILCCGGGEFSRPPSPTITQRSRMLVKQAAPVAWPSPVVPRRLFVVCRYFHEGCSLDVMSKLGTCQGRAQLFPVCRFPQDSAELLTEAEGINMSSDLGPPTSSISAQRYNVTHACLYAKASVSRTSPRDE